MQLNVSSQLKCTQKLYFYMVQFLTSYLFKLGSHNWSQPYVKHYSFSRCQRNVAYMMHISNRAKQYCASIQKLSFNRHEPFGIATPTTDQKYVFFFNSRQRPADRAFFKSCHIIFSKDRFALFVAGK